jgi:hypothetical protein
MRKGPTCSYCHDLNRIKLRTPWLDGQSTVYIKAQLWAFSSGARRNDISEQVRNIARQMTSEEMNDAARYYAATTQRDRNLISGLIDVPVSKLIASNGHGNFCAVDPLASIIAPSSAFIGDRECCAPA